MTSSSAKTLLVLAVILLIVGMAGFSYEFYAIRSEKKASALLESNIQGERATSATLESLRAIQANDTDALNKVSSIIIAKDNPVPFLDQVESTGKRLGLKLHVNGVTVNESRGSKDDTLSVTLDTEGTWAQTLAFTHALESLPYRVMINNLNLTTDLTSGVAPIVGKQIWRSTAVLFLNVK